MPIAKATRGDWKWPAIFLALGLLGALAGARYFREAFPEASIDLRLSRTEISARAETWLRLRGLQPESFRESVIFDPAEEAKTYLERELDLRRANELMASQVNVWRWKVRRFKPPQKEELVLWLDPAGNLAGFRHLIEEQAPGARLSKDQAQRLAEIFLRAQKGVSLADYTLVQDELEARPQRHDHTFTWERSGFKVKDATYRLAVTIQGDQVGAYREFLKVPEQWSRDYQRLRSRNLLLNQIATFFYVPLLIAAIFVLVRMAGRKRVAWRASLVIGGVVGLIFAGMVANMFPVVLASMPTSAPYSTLVALFLVGALLAGAALGVFVGLLAAAGEPLYADLVPGRVRLSKLFTLPGLRTKEFFFSTLIGYGMAAMHIGGVVLFYIVARWFGAWAPLEVNYDNAISTPFPWIYPLAVSVFASTSEEFSFRLFAIPLLHRWLKSRWVAVLIPAFVWGFLHSGYPQQPAWIRGVEVGLIGVLAGWVMLRFGILATLVWHYTVDAVLIGMFLLRSENLYYRISGALTGDAVLIPLLASVVLYWQSKGFVEDERILNRPGAPAVAVEEAAEEEAAAAAAEAAPVAAAAPAYAAADAGRRRVALIAALAGLALLAIPRAPRLGDFIRYTIDRVRAERAAVEHLRKSGVDAGRFRRVTTAEQALGGATAEYLRQQAGMAQTNRVYAELIPSVFWRTRFFRPLEKEEYHVYLLPDGRFSRSSFLQEEKAPGPTLSMPEAQARAEALLKAAGVDLAVYNLVESNLEKRPARHDFTFVWEHRQPRAGDARKRVTVQVIGDRMSGPRFWVKIPEAWERAHTRPRLTALLPAIYFGVLIAVALFLFGKRIGAASLRWKLYVPLGLVAAAILLLNSLLNWPSWPAGYDTSVPWGNELSRHVLGVLLGGMGGFIGMVVLAMVADTLLALRLGRIDLLPRPGIERARYLREALLFGTCGALAAAGFRNAVLAVADRIPAPYATLSAPGILGVSGWWPAGSAALNAVSGALWSPMVLGAAVALALVWLKTPARIALASLSAIVIVLPAALTPLAFLRESLDMLRLLAVVAGLVWLLRRNVAAYLVVFAWASAIPSLFTLARHPALRADAVVFAGLLAVALIGMLLWIRHESSRPAPAAAPAATSGTA